MLAGAERRAPIHTTERCLVQAGRCPDGSWSPEQGPTCTTTWGSPARFSSASGAWSPCAEDIAWLQGQPPPPLSPLLRTPPQQFPHREEVHRLLILQSPLLLHHLPKRKEVSCHWPHLWWPVLGTGSQGHQATCLPVLSRPLPQEEQEGEGRLGLGLDRSWGVQLESRGPHPDLPAASSQF